MFLIGILIQLVYCFSLVSGLRCYNCKNLNSVSKCYFRTSCGQDESCSLSRYPDEYGVDIYSLGCLSKSVCDLIEGINTATFGRRTVASLTQCCNTDNCNKNLLEQSTHVPLISQTPIHQPTLKSTERPTSPAPAIYSSTTHNRTTPTVKPCLDTGTQCTQKDFQRLVCGVQEFEPLCAKSCGLC
ncbi:uncharacterized protein LOC143050963 isoform X1 [Mytilus galloprovincialis]|uniref:uncharacterized protein LOC143050963 isoform X1 n=1 Tax=Mytilus galloprovincialis TaxID=29158 RepID=UPI003F7CB7EB